MGVTSRKAAHLGTSALSLLNMIQKIFAFALLGSVAYSVPVAEPDAKADPLLPLITTYGAPLVYHAPNCTTEDEVIQIKKCAPKTENECEDIEVPSQKLEYTLKCQNVTRTHCSNGITTINADEPAEKTKREADPQLLSSSCAYSEAHLCRHCGRALLPGTQDNRSVQHC